MPGRVPSSGKEVWGLQGTQWRVISSIRERKQVTGGPCELDFERCRGVRQFRRDSHIKGMDVFMSINVGPGERGGGERCTELSELDA